MPRPTPCPSGRRHFFASTPARVVLFAFAAVVAGFAGLFSGRAEHVRALPSSAPPSAPAAAPVRQVPPLTTLRLHGLPTICNECTEGQGNGPATGGTKTAVGSITGLMPEDPPYTDPRGPFDPLSDQAPEVDVVTWNPAWISERLREFVGVWPGLTDIDEVSAASNIRIGGINGSEKVWLRQWYEPTHLDKDLNADDCLTAFENDTSRWRRWTMPDGGVPNNVPPVPPDLTEDHSEYDPITMQYGAPRRAEFHFDPDDPEPVSTGSDGVHLHGGFPLPEDAVCLNALSRPAVLFGGGDPAAATDPAGFPVEVLPYTDPVAPFNPQHPHAPAADTLTFNPVYMDEFRHFGEDLRLLTRQISNSAQNVRQKVYHRLWYEPDYVTKIIDPFDCEDDLSFQAVVQEFTYLYMDTTDNPVAVPPGASRFAFPIGTRADELPLPNAGGSLPMTGHFGYGLTTFDADFDGFPEPVSIHTEATIAAHFDTQWQANRPVMPGFPLPPIPGPVLDTDAATPDSPAAMFLDHMVRLENVTAGGQAKFRVYFTGGNAFDARPESVGGITSLGVGEAAIVGRLAPADPMVERILAEAPDPRFGTELRETYHGRDGVDGTPPDYRDPDPLRARDGWQTHQVLTTPNNVTQLEVPEGQSYLLTLNWRTHVGRLAF